MKPETTVDVTMSSSSEEIRDINTGLFKVIKKFIHDIYTEKDFKSTGVVISDLTAFNESSSSDTLTVPTVLNSLNVFKQRKKEKTELIELYQINTLVESGSMCLVLGKPNSGASTFLHLISGHNSKQFKRVEGCFQFDSLHHTVMFEHFKKNLVYSSEEDNHFPCLTVGQTIQFAVSCKTPRDVPDREQFIRDTTDSLIELFGLSHAKHTIIGNDYIKGISGGEKKRVSLIECLAARADIMCFDNSTKGLDSSTALEYVKAVKTLTDLSNSTTLININQASENIFQLFDKVCIFHEKRQVFFGSILEAVTYFESMGFYKDPKVTSPDFLASIIEGNLTHCKPGFETKVPRTAEEFHQQWVMSEHFERLQREISLYKELHPLKSECDISTSNYSLNFADQLYICCKRGFQNIIGSKAFAYSQLFSAIIQSLVIGSLFYHIPETTIGSYSRGSLMFFSLLYFAFIALTEIMKNFQTKSVILKQKRYCFYTPSANALSEVITDIPLKLLFVLVFSLIIYFIAHLRYDAGKFFIFVLFLWLVTENLTVLFQAVANLTPTISVANAVGGILLLAIAMYATYVIQLRSMHPWFKWIAYINPVYYGFEAMITTELNKMILDCSDTLIPSGPGYENITSDYQICGWYGATLGNDFVRGEQYLESEYGYKISHVWRNFGILIGFWCFFIFSALVGSEFCHFQTSVKHKDYVRSKIKLSKEDDIELQNDTQFEDKLEEFSDETSSKNLSGFKSDGTFVWSDVNYVIQTREGGERKLLDQVSGYIKPGTLTALMGASGAGKTTLLDVLSQRTDIGIVTGNILVNGELDLTTIGRRTGYVQQQDVHLSELTVRESLIFTARLRRSNDVSDYEKLEYVEKVITMLNMSSYADHLIGDPFKNNGLSLERRKKVSIGVELVTKPSLLLFLDEPFSGFGSEEAASIVRLLRNLADAGQAILCTIHQPSSTLFKEFDNLLLLERGKTVYFGDISSDDNCFGLLNFFQRNGAPPCGIDENPAEYILEQTISSEIDWSQIWNKSIENKLLHDEINRIVATSEKGNFHHRNPSYWYQLQMVIQRTFTQFYRDPVYIFSKFALNIVGGLFIGFTFWNIGNDITSLQNSLFVVFMVLVISSPLIHQLQDHASQARKLYDVRESKSKTFHWSLLLLCQFVAELPYTILASTLSFFCFYFCLQRNNSPSIAGVFYLNYSIIFQMYYISFGLWLYYMANDLIVSSVLVAFLFSFTVSFCGVMQPAAMMPKFWLFVYRMSPYTYLVEIFTSLLLHNVEVKCTTMESAIFRPDVLGMTCGEFAKEFIDNNGGYILTPESTFLCTYCKYKNGDEFLKDEQMSYNHLWRDFGIVVAFIVFNIFAMFTSYYFFSVKKILRKVKKFW